MNKRRMVVLTEGHLGVFSAKTAVCLIRHCPDEVVAVLDCEHVGADVQSVLGVKNHVPVLATVQETLHYQPDTLVIGVAPQGGQLPRTWRRHILEAIHAGMNVHSGLHVYLNDDAEFAQAAREKGVSLWDVRRPPEQLPVARGRAKTTRALRILTIGTDCNVGKMVASLEVANGLKARGADARFIATGQTGIMVSGYGIAIDRTISDFTAGAAEQMMMEHADADVLVVEGQGALLHPGFSGVTLGLLHGTLPDGVIVVHHPGREHMRGNQEAVAPISTHIDLCTRLCAPLHPTRVIGVAINGFGLSDEAFDAECQRASTETGLPVCDVIRQGVDTLVDAVLSLRQSLSRVSA